MTGALRIGFVGDGGAPEVLAALLQPGGIEVEAVVAPQGLALGTLGRHRGYLRLACQALRLSRRVDGLLIWQQYVALYYLLLAPFWPGRRRVPLMLYYLIYKPMKHGLADRWKFAAMQRLLRADELRRVYFLARTDRLFASSPHDSRRVLMHCPFRSAFIDGAGAALAPRPFQVFSGGLSNRDYRAIDALARCLPEAGFRIVARPEARRDLSAPNIDLSIDVYGDAFEQLICTSEAVVIPLSDPDVVSGQLVIMAALQAGTPVFVSRNSFVDDWLGPQRPEGSVIQYDSIEQLAGLLRGLLGRADAARRARARQLYEQHQDEQLVYREFARGWQEILAGRLASRPHGAVAGEGTR